MRHAIASVYQVLLSAAIFAACVYIYANSPLRDRIESRLFDIRTRLSPTKLDSDDVAIVTISEADIATFEPPSASSPAKDLSFSGLERLTRAIMSSDARVIAILLHAQVFPYDDDEGLRKIAALAALDRRILIGINNLGTADTTSETLPSAFHQVVDQVGKVDATRKYRRDVVREVVIEKSGGTPYLLHRLAAKLDLDDEFVSIPVHPDGRRMMRLNYFEPDSILTLSATDIISGRGVQDLAGRTVLIGYAAFRPWTPSTFDATHLNSPWQADGVEVDASSFPLVTFQAEALINLLRSSWLRDTSTVIVVLQSLLVAGVAFLLWRATIGSACFFFIGGWAVLIIMSALNFWFSQIYTPLADSLAASLVAMALGATLRMRTEGKHRAAAEATAASHAELASIQQRFLDRFTAELTSINRRVRALITFELPAGAPAALAAAHERLGASCAELDEYLIGMEQLNSFDKYPNRRRTLLQPVSLFELIDKVVRQFEARAEETNIEFSTSCPRDLFALADDYLLRQILFNLVSNAVKYSPSGGTVHVDAIVEEKRALIRITDQGLGIAREFHEKIFEKFYRIKDDRVYKVKGHGLGLYLCRYFAEQIEASIQVSSELGAGSTFTLTLRKVEIKASR